MAKQHWVHGFMCYHYWFTGKNVNGEPAMPLFFSWANDPWTKRWNGIGSDDDLLHQDYGAVDNWRAHFEYLVTFFKHKRYTKVDGKLMFLICRPGHIGDLLTPMLNLWDRLAQEHGLPGIHIVNTVNDFYEAIPRGQGRDMDASFHFLSTCPGLAASPDPSLRDACRENAGRSSQRVLTRGCHRAGPVLGCLHWIQQRRSRRQDQPERDSVGITRGAAAFFQCNGPVSVAASSRQLFFHGRHDQNGFAYLRALKYALQT